MNKKWYSKQLKRSKQYRKLLGIKIPDRSKDLKEVIDDLWYIIWEDDLLKPKIFKYSFVSDYFAIHFARKHLSERPYHIIKGDDLKEFGIVKTNIKLRYVQKDVRTGPLPIKYDFPIGLSLQNKKSLRTQYRRNLRRLLYKIIKIKNKKMSEIYVLKKIDEKPGVFFKKLRKQWFYELTYSVTFQDWYVKEESWRIDEINKAAKFLPRNVTEIANILIILEKEYSDELYDYKNDTYVTASIKIWKAYKDRINAYMKKKGYIPKLSIHNLEEAWKEMVYRGFLPETLLQLEVDKKKDIYLKCFNPGIDLIFPKVVKTSTEAAELQGQFGIIGFTGINFPK